jgi:hypothetical protein
MALFSLGLFNDYLVPEATKNAFDQVRFSCAGFVHDPGASVCASFWSPWLVIFRLEWADCR